MRISPLHQTNLCSIRALVILSILISGIFSNLSAQTSTEFWFAPPEVTQGHAGSTPIYVRVAAGALPATVTIDMPANPTGLGGGITVNLPANGAQTINLSAFVNELETTPANTVLQTGIHISATEEITAIYEVSPTNNPDIWALKGANGLGTEFYTPIQNLWPNGNYSPTPYTSFDIVATEDNTTILIYPTSDLDGGQQAYESFTITLDQGETYSASVTNINNPQFNPSGSIVVSDKPIAVSIKDDSISPPTQGCRDLNGDQIVPVDIVGDEYIVNKGGLNAGSMEYAYVVATQNNTDIFIDGVYETTLFNAETYHYQITNDLTYITGDKPFYLIHVSGFGCESGMAQLPPLNCAGSEQVSFVRSTTESFFINLLVRAGAEDAFVLNGDAGIIDPADFATVPGTGGAWVGAKIQFTTGQIAQGVNNLLINTEDVFSMGLINGGASSGCRYGYFSEFSAEIIVDAGPDQVVCANTETILDGSVSGGATQGIWSSNGTGTFSPDNTALDATYVPSLADLSGGTVLLTLTSVGNCFPVEDEVEIVYTPAPIVDAGDDILACENNTTVTLDGFVDVASGGLWSGGAGTFNSGPGVLDATYTPTAAEVSAGTLTLTLTSTGNGTCNPEFDTVDITFGPPPTADAGVDQTLCANNNVAQLIGNVTIAGGGEWTGGTGVFAPSNQSLSPTYTPSNVDLLNGSVTLTLTTTTNGGCSAVSDQIVLTYSDAPTANAGSDVTVCKNNADVTLAGSVTIATGGTWSGGTGTFTPDENTLNAVYTPSLPELLAGSVTLTLTTTDNGDCVAEDDQMTITFTEAPIVDAGADGSVCENNEDIQLNGSLVGAAFGVWSGGAGTFTPNTTTLNAVYTPTAAEILNGTVTLTLTSLDNGNCNAVSDDVTFSFTDAPTANAGVDQIACDNNPAVTLSGAITIAGGGVWSGGAGTFNPDNTALNAIYTPTAGEIFSGSVTLTLTTTVNGTCSPESDNMVITFTDSPTANAGANQILCANNSDIDLSGMVTIASGGTWSGGLGTYTPDANTLITTYSPTVSEINSGSLTLTLTTTGNGTCLAETDEIDITFTPAPVVDAGATIDVCSNNAQVSLGGSVTIAGGGTWSGGAGTFTPNANNLNALYNPTAAEIASGSLILTLTSTGNGNCSPVSDFVQINFTPSPTSNAGSPVTVCGNDPDVNLNGAITVATGALWSGGSGTFSPNASALGATYTPSPAEITAGTVTLTLTTTSNGDCNAVSSNMTITITPIPTVEAGTGSELCSNNADITLNGSVTVATGATWSGGSGTFTPDANTLNAIYTPSQSEINAGTVTLSLTSTGNGSCIAVTDNVTYTFGPAPTADAGTDIVLCSNNADATLNGAVTVATGGTWSGGAGTFTPNANTLNAVYTPTAAEIAAATVTLTLATTGNDDCAAVSDDVTISFTPAPTSNAGLDVTVCANAADVILNGSVTVATGGTWSGGAGTYNPDANTLNATYTPSAGEISAGTVTLTLTTTGNALCNAVSNDMVITITPEPTVEAGTGSEFCSNNADITLNGAVTIASGGTWSGGSGTFTPNANTLNAIYTPSQSEINAGTVTLTLTSTGNGTCVAVTDDVTYTFGPAPTADAGTDIVLCSNNADATLNGAVTVATGGTWSGGAGTFTPNANTLNAVYTPTAAEIAAATVTLTLTTTGNDDCAAVSDDVTISFTPAPTANAGTDVTVCANNEVVTLNGSVTVATGGTWSGGAGTYNPDANTLNATYTPSAGEISAGTVTLTLTTTGNALCNAVSNDMVITITPEPTVNAGTGSEFCANNADITLNGAVTIATGGTWSGGSGTFTPNSNTLNAIYTPSQSEINAGTVTLTLTSTGNGTCVAVTDDVTYTFGPAPTADAGTDIVLCSNNADATLNGAVTVATGGTWSGGAGTFAPNANTLSATYTPTAAEITAGTLTLTLTTTGNGDCAAVTDDVEISFTPSPTANAGTDVTVCGNDADVTLNGSISIASGGTWSGGAGTFAPDANTLNAVYTPSAAEITAGTVALTLTTTGNGTCLAVSDNMVITITPEPTVDAGTGEEFCANNADITLSGSVTVATGATWSGGSGTFTPNANTLNAIYTPSQSEINAGTVTLTLTSTGNGNCTPVLDNVTYTFSPAPTADAGTDIVLCSNNADASLNGSVTIATGGTWSGGAGTFAPNANTLNAIYTPDPTEIAAGTVTLSLTTTGNGDCVAVTDEVTITFTASPTSNAGLDRTVCANNADVTLNGGTTIATGGIWSGGSGTFTPNNTTLNAIYTPSAGEITAGTVTLTLTTTGNGLCNSVSDDMIITITPEPTVDAGVGEEYCSNNADIPLNGSVTIATGATWSGGSGTFTPNANTLNAIYTPSQSEINSGTITLTLTSTGNGTCIAVTDDVTYTFGPSPTADAGTPIVLCANNSETSLNGAITIATGGTWSGGSGTFSPNANTLNVVYTPSAAELLAGTVTLTLTTTGNGDCAAVTDDVTITYTPAPTANAGLDRTVCANNEDVALNGNVSIATGGTWSGGNGTYSPDANSLGAIYTPSAGEIIDGTVTLTLTTTGNGLCNQVTDQMVITITPEPTVDAGTGEEYCSNNADITLNGSVTIATGATWSGGSGTFTPDANTLNAIYTPSQSEINAGTITLTLTSTGNASCLAVTDDVTYTFGPSPTADAGTDIVLCSNNAAAGLNGAVTIATGGTWSGGAGTFTPNANTLNAVYTPTAAEITAGTVTLTLTTTGNGDCAAVTDDVVISFTPAPTSSAGIDRTVCANNSEITLNGSVTVASGGTWTGGAGTFTPDANTLNATYQPSVGEIAAGTVTLTLTTTGNALCNAVTDEMVITITPEPTVDAGTGEEYCSNNADISLNGSVTIATGGTWSGGSGTFTPDANTLNAIYSPSQSEINAGTVTLTLTSTGNATCSAVTDDVTYTFGPSPAADAGVDIIVCSNNADASLNGAVTIATGGTWSGGAGSFSPSANALNATYTPTAGEITAGTVTLTLTTTGNGDCLAVTDDVVISFTPSPTSNAGLDRTVCANNADVTLNGSVTVASGGTWSGGAGTFSPDANTLDAIYSPSLGEIAAGTVTLSLTTSGNGDCLAVTDQMTITITPEPIVDAGTGTEFCSNNADITLNGSVTIATGGTWSGGSGTFTPDATALNAIYSPSQSEINAGTVTLTLTSTGNGTCIPVTDNVTYTFGPAPTADAGTDIVVCSNNANATLNGAVTIATGGTWSGGAGSFTPNANALNAVYTPSAAEITAGTVTLTLTTTGNGDCLAESDDVTISFTASPTANAGLDQGVCANNVDVALNGNVTVATGGTWSGGSGTFTPDANTLNAVYTPSAGEISAGTVTLTLTTTGNALCNAETDEMVITITPQPTVNAGADFAVCSNNNVFNLSGSVANAGGGQWSGGLGTYDVDNTDLNATYTPTIPEVIAGSITFTLTSTLNGGCTPVTDEVTVTFTPSPTVDAGADIVLCAATPAADLSGAFTVSGGAQWSGGAGTFNPNVLDMNATYTPTAAEVLSGSLTLTLTTISNGNCLPVSDEVVLTFDPEPTVQAGVNLVSCANDPIVQLNASFTNADGVEWSGGTGFFNPSDEDPLATYTPSNSEVINGFATLTLTTTGSGACPSVDDDMTITINPAPVVDAGLDIEVCANNNIAQLSGSVQFAGGAQWSGGLGTFSPSINSLNATYQPTAGDIANGFVTLTLTSTSNGSCLPEDDQMTITFTPAPAADAGTPLTVCANNADVQLNGSFTVADGANWSGGAGTFSPDNTTMNAVYTPSANEILNGSATLTLTTFGNGDCFPASSQVSITITPAPEVEAGEDYFACVDDLNAPLGGIITGPTNTGTWTSTGTGLFVPSPFDLNAVYQISSQDSLIGSVVLTLTSTNNGNCTSVSDDLTVFISPAGTADAGPDVSTCANNAGVVLQGVIGGSASTGVWITDGSGAFSPSDTDVNATYLPSEADLLSGSVTLTFAVNSCNQATDEMVITYTPAPVVTAAADITVCSSETDVQLGGTISGASNTGTWTTNGAGTFVPDANTINAVYQFAPSDVTTQVLTMVLTPTNINNCVVVTDTMIVNIFPQGTADAGENSTACENNPELQLNGEITGADQALWTTSGTGSFAPDANQLDATYVPSEGDLVNGSVNLFLNAVNSCNNASDFITLDFVPAPIVDAGPDIASCGPVAPFAISGSVSNAGGAVWSTLGSGTFQNNTNLSTFYVASQDDIDQGGVNLLLTSIDNGTCFPVVDTLFIGISTGIVVDAGDDREACIDAGQIQLVGSVTNGSTSGTWTTTGTGTFSPTADQLTVNYVFSAADITNGSVTITLTSTNNGICAPESDSFVLTFGSTAFVDAGPDVEVCETTDLIELDGQVSGETTAGIWTSTGTGTFFPSETSLNAFYEPTAADIVNGSVQLTLTSTGSTLCSEGSDGLTINFQPLPEADAGDDHLVCGNIEAIQLLGSVSGANGGVWTTNGSGTFAPSDSVLTALYTPSSADSTNGNITLTLTTYGNGDCIAGSDEVEISFSGAVVVNAGNDQDVCATETEITLSGSVDGSSIYVWTSNGTGTFNPAADILSTNYEPSASDASSGSVTLYLEAVGNGNCPSEIDSLIVNFDPLPVISVDSEISACVTDTEVQVQAEVTNADDILWTSTGGGVFVPNATSESVAYQPTPGEIASGQTTITITATSNGVCGAISSDVDITFNSLAIVDAGSDFVACSDVGSVVLDGSVQGNSTTGEWSTTSFGTFTPDAAQLDANYEFGANDILLGSATLILTSTNNGACPSVSDTVLVAINNPPTVSAGEDGFVCETTGIVPLNGTVEDAASFEWTSSGDGVFLPSADVIDPEYIIGNADEIAGAVTLTFTATALEGCQDVSDDVVINISNPLEANFSYSSACVGSTVQFVDQTQVLSGSIESWRWDFGGGATSNQQNPEFIFEQPGNFPVQLIVVSSLGCNDTITQLIPVVNSPIALFDVPDNPAPINFDVSFIDSSVDAITWDWDFGDNTGISDVVNPTHSYSNDGNYEVTLVVSGEGGCVDSTSTIVQIQGVVVLPPRLPNTFSPNDDGMNDVFLVRGGPFTELEFKVYDGWGAQIFQSNDQAIGWDGNVNGKQSPVGVYVYTVVATNLNGEEYNFSSKITLIR